MLSNETADRGRAPPPPPAAAATIGSGQTGPASAAHADTPGVAVATVPDSTRIQHDAPPQIQHDNELGARRPGVKDSAPGKGLLRSRGAPDRRVFRAMGSRHARTSLTNANGSRHRREARRGTWFVRGLPRGPQR